MRRIVAFILTLLLINPPYSRSEDSYKLGRIVVTPSRLASNRTEMSRSVVVLDTPALEYSNYNTIPDVLGNIGGIDMRRRGIEGVQADVSIRGTTFEQNMVMIDGVKIGDPQTGHYNMDIPITTLDVDRIEVLKGPASSLYGPNSFGGVINIITRKPKGLGAVINAEGGSFDYFNGGLAISSPVTEGINNRFCLEKTSSSGYMSETEFDILSLSDSILLETPYGVCDFLFGYTKKDFGADSFYSNLYSNEEEHTDTRFFKLEGDISYGSLKVIPKLYLKRHWDKFALDINKPGWQTNYHTTYTYGGEIGTVYETCLFDLSGGYELSQDTIDSTNIQKHSRTKDGIYLEFSPRLIEDLNINAGLRGDYFSGFGWEWSPSVNISYSITKELVARALAGRAYRIPTFTDLYYNDAANIGNPSLIPESSWTYEAGASYRVERLSCSAAYFHRDTYDTIDWTRANSKLPWRVSNIGSMETNGFELNLSASLSPVKAFFGYTVIDTYRKHDYLSKYALDYLKQHISSGIEWEIEGFVNSWVINYKKRIGDSGYIVTDTKISKDIINKDSIKFNVFLEISNIFDTHYSEQSDIPMPGRWIKSGGRVEF